MLQKVDNCSKREERERDNMWRVGVFMIQPCCSLTVAISLELHRSILLSVLSLYIATMCG